MDYKNRDIEVVKAKQNGDKVSDIAEKFNISKSRVRVILKDYDVKCEKFAKISKLLKELKIVDNINHKWSALEVLDLFIFPTATHRRLEKYIKSNEIKEISFHDIMDLVLNKNYNERDDFYKSFPVLNMPGIGRNTYMHMIRILNTIDIGQNFETEWNRRVTRLKNSKSKHSVEIYNEFL